MREQLLTGLAGLVLVDELDRWAQSCLPTKNTLTATDARLVEAAFQTRLATLTDADNASILVPAPEQPAFQQSVDTNSSGIDKSQLAIPEPRRVRNKIHLRLVAKQPCLICGRRPCDAHHLRFAQPRGLGLKVSDEFTVPLCRGHHREVHRAGDEARWWTTTGVDAIGIARKLWIETHPIQISVSATGADAATPDAATTATTMPPRGPQNPLETQMTKRSQFRSRGRHNHDVARWKVFGGGIPAIHVDIHGRRFRLMVMRPRSPIGHPSILSIFLDAARVRSPSHWRFPPRLFHACAPLSSVHFAVASLCLPSGQSLSQVCSQFGTPFR